MREIRTSGLMSGEEKRSHRRMPRATALFLDSTAMTDRELAHLFLALAVGLLLGTVRNENRQIVICASGALLTFLWSFGVVAAADKVVIGGDYYRVVQKMSGEQAFGKLADSTCPLVKK
jgi:hypothetical protein